jgi:tetratricopeptide (TPR) repeat protein
MANNIKTLTLLGKAKACLKHEDALKKTQQAVEKAKELKGIRSRVYGLTLYEEGKLHRAGKKEEAIKLYEKAIESIRMSNENEFEEDIIKIYQ